MEKRHRSVSLSLILLRFVITTGLLVSAVFLTWYYAILVFQAQGWVLPGYTAEREVLLFIQQQEGNKSLPSDDVPSMASYVLFDARGNVLGAVNRNNYKKMVAHYKNGEDDGQTFARYTYPDGTSVLFTWQYLAQFSNSDLRNALPPFEYIWYAVLVVELVVCVTLTTLNMRKKLVQKLRLLSAISQKVGQQELNFDVPQTGIKEFDETIGAMDEMRVALRNSLSAQWVAERQRQNEISALAHDLKTPLTIIGGNAELLLEDAPSPQQQSMLETIERNANRAKHYVASMQEAVRGIEEPYENAVLRDILDRVIEEAQSMAAGAGVQLEATNTLAGTALVQIERLNRALGNVVQNAIEHTPAGQTIKVCGKVDGQDNWIIRVEDNGNGFSSGALHHATERFWRGDTARKNDGHNGLGLWFANEVVTAHDGTLTLANDDTGGVVKIQFAKKSNG